MFVPTVVGLNVLLKIYTSTKVSLNKASRFNAGYSSISIVFAAVNIDSLPRLVNVAYLSEATIKTEISLLPTLAIFNKCSAVSLSQICWGLITHNELVLKHWVYGISFSSTTVMFASKPRLPTSSVSINLRRFITATGPAPNICSAVFKE